MNAGDGHNLPDDLLAIEQQVIACRQCPRLVEYREQVARQKRHTFRDWDYWGRPVPGFGDSYARVVIVGLAPAAHGGNRTGRIFTGDPSSRFLMGALYDIGFASQPTSENRDDGLRFRALYITASVKCAPPDDRPTVKERVNCLPYLRAEFTALRLVRVAVVLGRIAFDAFLDYVAAVRGTRPRVRFEHGAFYSLGPGLPLLAVSYHVSPRNTATGRLTRERFVEFLHRVRQQAELGKRGIVPEDQGDDG